MKRIFRILISLCLIFLSACEKEPEADPPEPVIDIFVLGSSFTNHYVYYFQMLANSMGDSTWVGDASIGNASLQIHLEESNTLRKITEYDWDYVMIQESGYMAGITEEESRESTFPCVELLVDTIRALHPNARIGLFMTQAYEQGHKDRCDFDPEVCTYEGMQTRIIHTNIRLAKEYDLELAPVGYYWQQFSQDNPGIRLFSDDHTHGSPEGCFLTACIIYATIYQKSLSANIANRTLSAAKASLIQNYVNEQFFDDEVWQAYFESVK